MNKKKDINSVEKISLPNHYCIISADLSLTRPGFAKIEMQNNSIISVSFTSIDNKSKKNKTHGQILAEILLSFSDFLNKTNCPIYLVREKEIMHLKVPSERSVTKVVGVMDLWLYTTRDVNKNMFISQQQWYEIYPVTVKKLIAGSGKAEKSEVAEALEKYIGKREYKCDDESDAAAVGVAWLIQQGQIKGLG